MNERQAFALAHPLNAAAQSLDHLRTVQHVGRGEWLVVILAVDR